jgi:D-glycero-D-manno-heptose 1,7-bisphosphate phosphatase
MKRAAVFFDRDNTLMVCNDYLGDPAGVVLMEGAAAAVARARQYGFKVVVVSNQSGVARGMFTEAQVQAVNARLEQLLQLANPQAIIDRHEYCPYHPDATVEQYRRDSDLRKPRPGMLLAAAEALNLDLSRCWLVGDAPRDIEAGKAAGCRTILFTPPNVPASPAAEAPAGATPDFACTSLVEAVEYIGRQVLLQEPAVKASAPAPVIIPAPPEAESDIPTRAHAAAPAPSRPQPMSATQDDAEPRPRAEQLLELILAELRRSRPPAQDFSLSRVLAGSAQVVAAAALVLACLYHRQPAFTSIMLFAIAMQTLTISLLLMGRPR